MREVRQKTMAILFLLATVSWMGFILYLSSKPSSFYEDLSSWIRPFQHLMQYPAHFFLYFLLFQFCRGFFFCFSGPQGKRKALLMAFLCTAGFGILDELYQSTVPTRTCDPKDWGVDSLAAFTGVLLYQFLFHRLSGARRFS